MPVDPQLAGLLDVLAASKQPPMALSTPQQARAGFRRLTVDFRAPDHVVPVAAVEETTVDGGAGPLAARVYRPAADGPVPTVVFFHGGGWVIGDLDTHDNVARALCRDAEAVVVSVDYRLAPEHPFPAAVEDAVAATTWVAGRLADLGGSDLLGAAGDSAGGNLSAVVAQHARATGLPLAGQLLVYPAVDATPHPWPSRVENAHGYFLDVPTMQWFTRHYRGEHADLVDVRLSPLHAEDLSGLAPAVLVTAEFDPLRDEGEAYARRLQEAGVPVEVRRYDGLIHGFVDMGVWSPAARAAVAETFALFGKVLRG